MLEFLTIAFLVTMWILIAVGLKDTLPIVGKEVRKIIWDRRREDELDEWLKDLK